MKYIEIKLVFWYSTIPKIELALPYRLPNPYQHYFNNEPFSSTVLIKAVNAKAYVYLHSLSLCWVCIPLYHRISNSTRKILSYNDFSNALCFSYFEGHNIFDCNDIIALTRNELEGAKSLTGTSQGAVIPKVGPTCGDLVSHYFWAIWDSLNNFKGCFMF